MPQVTAAGLVPFQENETAIEFAHRVKADICSKGGLVDLDWWDSKWDGTEVGERVKVAFVVQSP